MSILQNTLSRIETWLLQNYPEALVDLLPGISPDEIEEITTGLPFIFPDELYELYSWHNGFFSESVYSTLLFGSNCFNSMQEALVRYEQAMSIQEKHEGNPNFGLAWDRTWFPVCSGNSANLVIVCDQKRQSSALHEQYFDLDDFPVKYESMSSLLLTALECLEQGVYIPTYQEDLLVFEVDDEREEAIRRKHNPSTSSFL